MKRNDELVLKYLSDLMSKEEKLNFENELKSSAGLSVLVQTYKSKMDSLRYDEVELDSTYLANILPRVRERIDKDKRSFSFFHRKIFYAIPTTAVAVLAFILFYTPVNQSVKLNEAAIEVVNQMNEAEVIQSYLSDVDTNPEEYIAYEKTDEFNIQLPEGELNFDALEKAYTQFSNSEYESISSLSNTELDLIANNINTVKIK